MRIKRKKIIRRKNIFISYSWDNPKHKAWVKKLADKLTKVSGLHVIFDQYDLRIGSNMTHFMENALRNAKKVLIILTPNYAKKADKRKGGVGHEYSIINSELSVYREQPEKYLPILRKGNIKTSCPNFLKVFVNLDMRVDKNFSTNFKVLEQNIFEKYKIVRPPYGDNPENIVKNQIKKQNAKRKIRKTSRVHRTK